MLPMNTLAKVQVTKPIVNRFFSDRRFPVVIMLKEMRPTLIRYRWILPREIKPVAVFGQAARIVLGVLGSAVGVVPLGNTGGSTASMFRRMPIEPELQRIIDGGAPSDSAA
jgi:hypothetical protein